MKIKCFTLFDITKTNISNRRQFLTTDTKFVKERNQQSNFETILQILSLRTQPENITDPQIIFTDGVFWNNNIKEEKFKTWVFTFEVNQSSVFKIKDDDLGSLKLDCVGVPMILNLDENTELNNTLNYSDKKNIHFEVQHD